ncbi:LCP family protein [Curtobacterium sp. MCPF17_052]|nr:LCP family protein [Curtobacterium sp. MCPF17_052]WIB11543.1 LCP family protein [Curtobacterium sp. MCPF17_052]
MAVLLSGGYAAYAYNRLASSVTKVDAIGSAPPAKDDVDGRAMNILLVGDDHRPDNATPEEMAELNTQSDGGATNTDTMIVLHIAADGRSATMISFPRDSYVDIPGVGKGKLNSAFSYGTMNGGGDTGGAKKLIATIQGLSGLTIDHYVRVSLLGFYEIVKQLGPVNVCLNQAVQDDYSGVDLPAGVSELNASQALSFVRQRHGLPNGDLDRQVRQQYFLSQEARKILSAGTLLNPVKTTNIIDAIGSSVETDQGLDMLTLARQMSNLRPSNIKSATIPILGTPTIYPNGSALSIVEVDTAGMPAFVQGLVGEPPAYTKATAAAAGSVTVTVSNGSGVTGAAAAASTVLAGRGFQVGAPRFLGHDGGDDGAVPGRHGGAGQGTGRRRARRGAGPEHRRAGGSPWCSARTARPRRRPRSRVPRRLLPPSRRRRPRPRSRRRRPRSRARRPRPCTSTARKASASTERGGVPGVPLLSRLACHIARCGRRVAPTTGRGTRTAAAGRRRGPGGLPPDRRTVPTTRAAGRPPAAARRLARRGRHAGRDARGLATRTAVRLGAPGDRLDPDHRDPAGGRPGPEGPGGPRPGPARGDPRPRGRRPRCPRPRRVGARPDDAASGARGAAGATAPRGGPPLPGRPDRARARSGARRPHRHGEVPGPRRRADAPADAGRSGRRRQRRLRGPRG